MDKKMWCICMTDYYLAVKKELNLAICNNMDDLEDIMLSEIS